MTVLSMVDLPVSVPLGVYTGGFGSQAVLDELNKSWRNATGGVIFGQDTFGEKFKAFSNMVMSQAQEIHDTVLKTIEAECCPNKVQEILCSDDFFSIPACMYIPILTDPRIRPFYETGQLNAWGVKSADMPEEDVVGRLIKNGRFSTSDPDYKPDSLVTWTFKSNDPEFTSEELEKIESTRDYICSFLEAELGPEGEKRDFTDFPNRMGDIQPID